MTTIPFTAQTRMSGVDFEGHEIRKGAADASRVMWSRAAARTALSAPQRLSMSRAQAALRCLLLAIIVFWASSI